MARNDERWSFTVEYFDHNADLLRQYQLFWYTGDSTVEMYDVKNRRTFLKRCEYPPLKSSELYPGSVVEVFSRQLKVVEYADDFTRAKLGVSIGKTFAMIKPDAFPEAGNIIDEINNAGLRVNKMRTVILTREQACAFYNEHSGRDFFENLVGFMTSGRVLAMELVGTDAVAKWRGLIGPTNTDKAKQEAPDSLRAKFGTDGTRNAVHGSDSNASADRECAFFFGSQASFQSPAGFENCSIAVILPHILKANGQGQVIQAFQSQQDIAVTAIQMFNINKANAKEFLEVYEGVIPDFSYKVEELTSGACIALAVAGSDQTDVVQKVRELAGPYDPHIAQVLRPNTIRANFGVDKVKNCIHVTDLDEDGPLEVEYFFNLLQNTL